MNAFGAWRFDDEKASDLRFPQRTTAKSLGSTELMRAAFFPN